ncbi:MAG: OmpH family outer membrane protein [Bacteroidetes bacterium]|nr:MAG: OmpH family outer membrane protein [Bacteroidota bacterium]
MKKLLVGAMALVGFMMLTTNEVAAQNKFGYFNIEYLVAQMPGVSKVDTLMAVFQSDSLNPEYQFELEELKRMDSTLKADSLKMPARLYQQRQQEQAQRFYKLQNWQQYSQQVMQNKQEELMAPFYNKIYAAFKQVVDEGKYTYVFKEEGLLIAPPGDNLIPLVAKKVGLKLPGEPAQQQAPAAKPAAKPATKQ